MPWPGRLMASSSPRQVVILLYRYGRPILESTSSPAAAIAIECTPWPGHPMASILLRRREAVLITTQIIQCAYGRQPAEILSISIAVTLTMYLPWRGRLMGSKSHRLQRITQCQYGKRDESGWRTFRVELHRTSPVTEQDGCGKIVAVTLFNRKGATSCMKIP